MAIIVIDPGHGGTAPVGGSTPFGVRGARGTIEKEVTLRLAQRLGHRFGGQAALTRRSDVNLSLEDRAALARRSGARVFLSLHANDGPPGARGCEAWVHPRASASARSLAERVHEALAPVTGPGRGVQTGPMAVLDPQRLGHADACLVEVDHLSDQAGGARLASDRALDAMADALAGAVRAHLKTSRFGRAVPKVTAGEYSQALDDYLTIILSDPAEETIRVNLLRRSATFLAVMKSLDSKTIASGSAADNTISYTDIDQGRVTAGPHKGKFRVEMTHFVDLGHRFIPGTSPEAPWNANFVTVEESGGPNGPDRGTFVEAFVHETMHLDAAVFSRFPAAGSTLAQKIDAFFDEEISVRTKTLAIMKEITKGSPSDLSGYVTPTPPMIRRDVERDFQSGADRLTYLEGVVFDSLIAEAIVAESIDAQTLTQLTKQANEESVGPSDRDLLGNIGGFVLVWDPQQKIYVNPATKTLELLIRRRAVQARWKMLFDAGLSAVDQEAAAQKHASLFFPTGIQYTP